MKPEKILAYETSWIIVFHYLEKKTNKLKTWKTEAEGE